MNEVLFEKKGHIGILTMNTPNTLNSLNTNVLKALNSTLDEIENDSEIFVLVITGAGKAFVAGADIAEMLNFKASEVVDWVPLGSGTMTRIENLKIPVIAAVNGFALGGGCELALACDIRIASEKAKFGLPEVTLGILPGFGGTQRLPRLVGEGVAKELIFTGSMIDANEAYRIGLVNKVVPADELLNSCIAMAEKIAKNAQIGVRQAKKAVTNGMQTDVITGIAYENQLFSLCFSTEDQKTGMGAFVNKVKDVKFSNK